MLLHLAQFAVNGYERSTSNCSNIRITIYYNN